MSEGSKTAVDVPSYICAGCAKTGEVAFRVNPRKPDKIARATPDTPKPLCLTCAEKRREELLVLRDQPKPEPKPEDKPNVAEATKETKEEVKEAKELSGDVKLNWRWTSSGKRWTKRRPTEIGDYWIWHEKDYPAPILRKINPVQPNSTMQPFLENPETWYLGPCAIPPTPKEAIEQNINNKKDAPPA